MQKQKILNLSFDIQRRQALEHLKNLGVLAFTGAMFYSLKPLENVFENLSLSKSQSISSYLNQILKLIVLDEILKEKNLSLNSLELTNCTIYQLPHTFPLFKEFRDREKLNGFEKDEESPIHAYNDSLQIIEDYAKGIYANSKNKKDKWVEDRNKARRLLKNLNIIGQNNLKAMYVGVNNNQENPNNRKKYRNDEETTQDSNDTNNNSKIPPKFVGRLATTIIIEDGLYIG